MKLIRLACATGIILVSGGCAPDGVTTPAPVREAAREPSSPITRLREALAGRAPGVTDGSVRVIIRENWLPLQPEPLYVIDGVPLSHEEMVVAEIDPERIVDIRVMKAPAAVETYGPRGKNGALLITLKPTL